MKLLRKRWWGFYAIMPWLLLAIPTMFYIIGMNFDKGNTLGIVVSAIFLLACLSGILIIYAPYTFQILFRILGLLVFIVYVWYLTDSILIGKFLSHSRSEVSALNAALGLVCIGIPGLLIFIKCKRDERNPYRYDGSIRKPLLKDIRNYEELFKGEFDDDNNDMPNKSIHRTAE